MRTRLFAAVAVLAAAVLAPSAASAATIAVTSSPFASTVGLSWDVTATGVENVFRAPAPCTSAPMSGAVVIDTSIGAPPADQTTTDAPGSDGGFCYYVQDDADPFGYSNTVQALIDTTPPSGTLTPPAAAITGTVALTATASDAVSGVDKVEFQSSPAGANTFTTFDTDLTDNAVTYNGTLNTTTLSGDGLYDLRVRITDLAGNPAAFSAVVANVRVDNTHPTVNITAPATLTSVNGGGVTVSASAGDSGGSGISSVQFFADGGGGPVSLGTVSGSGPYTVSWNATVAGGFADGLYTISARATDGVSLQTTDSVASVRVDNTGPTGTISAPAAGSLQRGTVGLTASVSDATGVGSVQFLASNNGGSTWTPISTDNVGPSWTASWDTTGLNGSYLVMASMQDVLLNPASSTPAVALTLDNTAPTGALTAPLASANLGGTVNALSATASDAGGSGVASVRFESSPNGTTGWSTIATSVSVSSPYTANWSTTGNATLFVHAVITDTAGNIFTTTPAVVVTVDNTAPNTPAAPTGLTSVSASPTITFAAVSDPGSPHSGIGHYDIFRNGGSTPINVTPLPAGGPYTWSDVAGQSTSPAAGTNTYSYTVAAVDLSGNVSAKSAPLAIFMDATAASAPTSVQALASPTSQRPQISWASPSWTTPAFAIDHYNIYRNGTFLTDFGGTTFTDNQVSLADNSYSYQVVAASLGDATTGIASATVTVVYDTTPPSTPAGVVASAAIDGSVNIAWSPVGDGSGSGVARYVVRRALGSVAPPSVTDGDATCQGVATSCVDPTVLNGKLYSYAVFAVDRAGNTSLAGVAAGVTARDQLAPAQPSGLSATPGDASIGLQWAAAGPDDDVAGYVLVAKQGAQAPASETDGTRVCPALGATSTSCVATGLSNGATYTFGLFALDEALNRSQPAVVSGAPNGKVTDAKGPAAVSKLKAKVSGHTVTLTWKNPADKDFDHVEITAGQLKPAALKASKRVYSGKGSKATTTIAQGQSRWFVVVAYDTVGNASEPASVHVVMPAVSKFAPAPKAKVHGKVRLAWPVAKGARYYNVQVFAGKKRILVSWPAGRALRLPKAKLKRGTTYTWYVWPGLGVKAKAHYGKLIGKNAFTFTG